jgi:hypothetical protein
MRLTCPSTLPGFHWGSARGDRVLVSARAGNEGCQRGLSGGGSCGDPLAEIAAAAAGHRAGVLGEGGSGGLAAMESRLGWPAGSRSPGLVRIQAVTARGLGGCGAGARMRAFPRKRARWSRTVE